MAADLGDGDGGLIADLMADHTCGVHHKFGTQVSFLITETGYGVAMACYLHVL